MRTDRLLFSVQMQPRSTMVKSLMVSSNSSASVQWDDDRAQQLFQQLCNLK